MVGSNKFHYILLAILVLIIVGVTIGIISDMRTTAQRTADADAARAALESAKTPIEEVFAEPAGLFEELIEGSALEEFRKMSKDAVGQSAMREQLMKALRSARATYPDIHGLYVIDRDGKVVASDGDDDGDDSTFMLDSTERALLLREGEVAMSRVHAVVGPAGKEISILYSTPIECAECLGQPQIGAIVAMVHLDAFFKKLTASTEVPATLFVVNAEGQYLFDESHPEKAGSFSGATVNSFTTDFPDDYANIIELRGTHSFDSKDKKRTYFVETLYPGLDGRVHGIPRKLNVRYIPTEQQFWVVGFYK